MHSSVGSRTNHIRPASAVLARLSRVPRLASVRGAVLAAVAAAFLAAPVAAAGATLTASASPSELVYGKTTTISGTLSDTILVSNQTVQLEVKPFGATSFTPTTTTTTDTNGNYSFPG